MKAKTLKDGRKRISGLTLSKLDLITMEDLDKILKLCNTEQKALIMVIFDAGLRKSEALNIKFKHIQFEIVDNILMALINIAVSKTRTRDLYFIESVPYLKALFETKIDLQPEDFIFGYTCPESVNSMFGRKEAKMRELYGWTKRFTPHLLRHSKLTDLAAGNMNEAQLRKVAGWIGDSDMPKIYFHLDDSDIQEKQIEAYKKKKDIKTEPKKRKQERTFKTKICLNPDCKFENTEQSLYCVKCYSILDERLYEQNSLKEEVKLLTGVVRFLEKEYCKLADKYDELIKK